jgi:hypothetical protein
MPEEPQATFVYRILRYMPNLLRDEWVNIGVLLEDRGTERRNIRLIEESQITRVRRIHPDADQDFLRSLPAEFETAVRAPAEEAGRYFEKMNQTLSNLVQFSPQKAVLGENFDAELDRLFLEQVAAPRRRGNKGTAGSTRETIKSKINDVLRRRRVPGIERNIPVEEFTGAGDRLTLDYAYRNGVRGYIQALTLGRDPANAKVLAFTAERIRERLGACEFTAITEAEPDPEKPRHQFIRRLMDDEEIEIVSLPRIDKFAEDLRDRLQSAG